MGARSRPRRSPSAPSERDRPPPTTRPLPKDAPVRGPGPRRPAGCCEMLARSGSAVSLGFVGNHLRGSIFRGRLRSVGERDASAFPRTYGVRLAISIGRGARHVFPGLARPRSRSRFRDPRGLRQQPLGSIRRSSRRRTPTPTSNGHTQTDSLLGRGGHGIVYLACTSLCGAGRNQSVARAVDFIWTAGCV